MRLIMLRNNTVMLQSESKFEEKWLEVLVKGLEAKAYTINTGTDEQNHGFLSILPNYEPRKIEEIER